MCTKKAWVFLYINLDFFSVQMYCYDMKTFREIFSRLGISAREAARRGIPYDTLCKHLQGAREVGPKAALRYEKVLGIPRWEMRPDLWSKPGEENRA